MVGWLLPCSITDTPQGENLPLLLHAVLHPSSIFALLPPCAICYRLCSPPPRPSLPYLPINTFLALLLLFFYSSPTLALLFPFSCPGAGVAIAIAISIPRSILFRLGIESSHALYIQTRKPISSHLPSPLIPSSIPPLLLRSTPQAAVQKERKSRHARAIRIPCRGRGWRGWFGALLEWEGWWLEVLGSPRGAAGGGVWARFWGWGWGGREAVERCG